jgi:hypothetical protein
MLDDTFHLTLKILRFYPGVTSMDSIDERSAINSTRGSRGESEVCSLCFTETSLC